MHDLWKVTNKDDWIQLHLIRREVLFDPGVMPFEYDENHPDDRYEGNTPFLLKENSEVVGVARLDKRGRICTVRMVGIRESYQRRGHGRALSALIDENARRDGIETLQVNASGGSIGFYEKTGWHRHAWDPAVQFRLPPGTVQMIKQLSTF